MDTTPKSNLVIDRDLMVQMRDQVKLATDVYYPQGQASSEALPVLLERTPYDKQDPKRSARASFFARHGYVVVLQDCRGCYGSGGDLYFLANEPRDGYDTVEWIAAQDWCDGSVGTFGTSYMSWTQSALASQNPPHLACMIPNMGGWNAHTSSVRQGGAFELRFMAWAFWHSAQNSSATLKQEPWLQPALNTGPSFREWLRRLPLTEGQTQLSLIPSYERWIFDIYTRGTYDDFWRQPGFAIEEHLDQHSDVPTLLVGGWYDSYTRATLDAYMALSRSKRGPIKVIIGPWTHGTYTTEEQTSGDIDLGDAAALESFDKLHLTWFDRWLRNKNTGIDREAPIQLFVMGGGSGKKTRSGHLDHGGSWRHETEWPLARTSFTRFYLHGNGRLQTELPAEDEGQTTYRFDPDNPVPTIGGNFSSLSFLGPLPQKADPGQPAGAERREEITPCGGYDQRESDRFFGCKPPFLPLGSRGDLLVFQTFPLEEDVEITGPIEVRLWVASSAPDTDFTAKLIDCYPPSSDYPQGYALNLTDSILRARFASSREKEVFLEPGEIYPLTVVLYPTSNLFKRGHSIRLDISSSNFPRFDVNPNTAEPLGRNRRKTEADNTIHHSRRCPSHIVLPIIARTS